MLSENAHPLNILQISTLDIAGGAERVAWSLHNVLRARGHSSWLAVGTKRSHDPSVLEISSRLQGANRRQSLIGRIGNLVRTVALKRVAYSLGIEDFTFPDSHFILQLPPAIPDLVHAHNLHGGYFDLRYIAPLSRQTPVALTLHDAWLLAGHCAHSFECTRWQDGCGHCPHLDTYPAIRRDTSAFNWRRKRGIFAHARLNIATPCQWLMDKVEQSILAPAIVSKQVIPNGVDTTIFRPGDKDSARTELDIPPTVKVLIFAANGIRQNPWKDYLTMRAAIERIAERCKTSEIWFLAVGEESADERLGSARIRFVPYVQDLSRLAKYYQAADLYLHAARADTFPNTVLEALACGIPVVATSVGGIPEQVRHGKTGFLVPPGDASAMAEKCLTLLESRELSHHMGEEASSYAARYFALSTQADTYLDWYRLILTTWRQLS